MIETLDVVAWTGPFDDAIRRSAAERLEAGAVLRFPALGFPLGEAEAASVRSAGSDGSAKNISLDPATGQCKGTAAAGAELAALTAMLERFARSARSLVEGLLPHYAAGLERARTSFRPVEIAGRQSSWRQDDKRLHVDAFPSRPLHGRRILRVFANIDPAGTPRHWRIGPDFETYAARFLPALPRAVPGRSWLLHRLGVTKTRRSRYDEVMLFLHDAAKRDLGWQRDAPAEAVDFPSGCAWMVFTDQVAHAAVAGRNALEQSFYVEPGALARPETAPLAVLERLCGAALV